MHKADQIAIASTDKQLNPRRKYGVIHELVIFAQEDTAFKIVIALLLVIISFLLFIIWQYGYIGAI